MSRKPYTRQIGAQRPGPPSLPPEIFKSARIDLRLTEEEYAVIRSAAELEDRSCSSFLRRLALSRAKELGLATPRTRR
jgi:uncharacterized protein (DUF1778 family)